MKRFVSFLIILVCCTSCTKISSSQIICTDPVGNSDTSVITFQNIDNVPIYVKYLTTSGGDVITPNTSMISTVIPKLASKSIRIVNDNFNHFYFYEDGAYSNEIGKFIMLNTQPNTSTVINSKVTSTGAFTSQDSQIKIQNYGNDIFCIKSNQISDWHFWNLSFPSTGLTTQLLQCSPIVLQSSTATNFHHIYFYKIADCSKATESGIASKIVYLNTQSTKININTIAVR